MPTKVQAQAKTTPNPQASNASRDQSKLAPRSHRDTRSGPRGAGALPAAGKTGDYPILESLPTSVRQPAPTNRGRTLVYVVSKRAFDLVVGTALMIVATPIVLAAALAIRINTPGSPFFFQTRLGKNGKPFKIFKLRGMYIDAKSRFPTYYDYSHKRDLEFCFHHEQDPRVTPAGRIIRKTSIDELPNLWNVVLGDMSLVGPRPEIPEVLALYGQYRDQYLSVKPGVTCLAKITGRDKLTKRETIDFDLEYIRTRSFVADLRILWRTIRSVLLRRDVF